MDKGGIHIHSFPVAHAVSRGARASAKSESGTVPLHLAAEGGHTAIIQVDSSLFTQPFQFALLVHLIVIVLSLWIVAALLVHFRSCPPAWWRRQALLEAGADVNEDCLPGCSWTPIFFACAVSLPSPAYRLAGLVYSLVRAQMTLAFSCQHGHYEASKLLVESGARLLIRDEEGNSPAEVAERWRERPRDLRF